MRYKSFTIENYRGISSPITLDLEKNSIFPIIGVNEAGKTTLLEAIFSFDQLNDNLINKKHLSDISNYYDPYVRKDAKVSSVIECSEADIDDLIAYLLEKDDEDSYINLEDDALEDEINSLKALMSTYPIDIKVTRNVSTLNYVTDTLPLLSDSLKMELGKAISINAPYILYFDDFRDSIEQYIEVPAEEGENDSKWLPYIDQLLKTVDSNISIYDLPNTNLNQRNTIIRLAQKNLQEALIKNWATFNVENEQRLNVEIKYHNNNQIEFGIVEKIEAQDETQDRFFGIKDRSKGFFWYFNFIMKLEFNPKKRNFKDIDTIYLLDEPGSFLHASAQTKLCELLKKISLKNKVLYCTHSPYLLDPKYIPINSIKLAEKSNKGIITIKSINDVNISRKNAAFEPVLSALEVKPITLLYENNNIVIVEGIYDYYAFEMFKPDNLDIHFFPSSGADSVTHHISYMIFLGKKYSVIWDNDNKGNQVFENAKKQFGEIEANKWLLLPKPEGKNKHRLEDLFEHSDIEQLKVSLELPSNTTFEKVIVSLYYSGEKAQLIEEMSRKMQTNLSEVYNQLTARLGL